MEHSNPFTGQNLRVFEAAFVYPISNKHIAHGDKSLQTFSIHSSQQSGRRNSFFLPPLSKGTFQWRPQIVLFRRQRKQMKPHSHV
jgi:hypothetical protein